MKRCDFTWRSSSCGPITQSALTRTAGERAIEALLTRRVLVGWCNATSQRVRRVALLRRLWLSGCAGATPQPQISPRPQVPIGPVHDIPIVGAEGKDARVRWIEQQAARSFGSAVDRTRGTRTHSERLRPGRAQAFQQFAIASSARQIWSRPSTPSEPSLVVSTDLGTAARLSNVATLS